MAQNSVNSSLPAEFYSMLKNSTHIQKKEMLNAVRKAINEDNHRSCASNGTTENIDFTDYVEHVHNFVPADFLEDALQAEVASMGLLKKTDKPLTKWLSSDERPYCFSDKPNLKHEAEDISQYPAISNLMNLVNQNVRTSQDANAALVLVYNKSSAAINFHDDNEQLIDSNSSISTVSFGSSRKIEFCKQSVRPRLCQYSVSCGNHDLMIMKPGCQSKLVHRVCRGLDSSTAGTDDVRIVISFRKLVDNNEAQIANASSVENNGDVPVDGDVPVVHGLGADVIDTPKERVTILAGDSFIVGLDVDRLGRRGKKTVLNLSAGGATISDVGKQLETYFLSNSDGNSSPTVEKIVICVGANDIRHCKENGVKHLKLPLISLIELAKTLFPDAKIWFQSVIPILIQNQFTAKNVIEYNRMLYDVCVHSMTYYLNVFKQFLQFDRVKCDSFRNEFYFVNFKNIHLNRVGLGLLARFYIKLIHSNQFNPLGY